MAVLAVVLLGAAVLAARTALRPDRSAWELPVVDAPDAQRPFFVMNPRSGGGKVARFDLQQRAEALGAEVALLDRPHTDVQQLARDALARGADLLGVAGGDGTQALVAQVAAEHDVPFLVDQRRHPQPLRPRPRPGPGGPGAAASTRCATGWRRGSTSARSTGGRS